MLQSYILPVLPRGSPNLSLARLPIEETHPPLQAARNERRTWLAALLVAVASAVQVVAGLVFGSVALVANGVHSGAHVAALAVAGAAYRVAHANAHNPRLAHGAGRIGDLAAFANAVLLALAAFGLAVESVARLASPELPDYPAALYAAAGGLVLNLACMALLSPGASDRRDPSGDINISAAHLHVAADAAVAALTLAGLFAAWRLGWARADPFAALIGAGLIAHFAASIIKRAGSALLDVRQSPALEAEVALRLEAAGLAAEDVLAWRTGPGRSAVAIRLKAPQDAAPDRILRALEGLPGVSRISLDLS